MRIFWPFFLALFLKFEFKVIKRNWKIDEINAIDPEVQLLSNHDCEQPLILLSLNAFAHQNVLFAFQY